MTVLIDAVLSIFTNKTPGMPMKGIGEKIREVRKQGGLSQEALAELAQVNLRTIQRIENNENEPRGKTLSLICEALNVNAEDILHPEKQTNKNDLIIFQLSVLVFLVIPLGNIIIPMLLWVSKRDSIKGLNAMGKNVLNFQILWSILSFLAMVMLVFKLEYFKIMVFVIGTLYVLNIILPIGFAIKINKGKTEGFYPNWLRFIK
ncbi:helix-turn-helix domain-containing protein [Oceanihabitans sp. IOP_32]|uniref:helix-turn-helix domain-containing protein n=1 Tax=Oceanihabitans sp. IOP_32 TaxID=2529032 RepID=UPI001D176EFE|nr:helix-turn-helix domain-containing protein [Oceanihabitans sp. IOP_32]